MKFGAFLPHGWRLDLAGVDLADQWPVIIERAQRLEANGFASLWVNDHFHTVPTATQEVTYEAWTLTAALAQVTDQIRLGQMCTSIGYRSPAHLAKIAASTDVLSGGRVDFGIGAGWYQAEYEAYGYDFPSAAQRIGQLEEGLAIMRRMWTEDLASYQGRFFSVDGAICQPKPLQHPMPVWVAGGGEQLTLRVVAQYADASNFGSSPEEFAHKSEILDRYCTEIDRDPADITRSAVIHAVCGEDEAAVRSGVESVRNRLAHFGAVPSDDRMMGNWLRFAGTPAQLVDHIGEWVDKGLEYTILHIVDAGWNPDAIDLIGSEVLPAFDVG